MYYISYELYCFDEVVSTGSLTKSQKSAILQFLGVFFCVQPFNTKLAVTEIGY